MKKWLIVSLLSAMPLGALAQAAPSELGAMFVSSDGTGNPGTFTPLSGSGGSAIQYVPTAKIGMMYSTDGTGNPGTWAFCTSTCGGGGGAVSSVSNSDGTLTISPTTGSVVASLALGHANTLTANWTAPKWIASTGFDITGATTSGHYLRNNGTDYVDSAILVGDMPTNGVASANTAYPFCVLLNTTGNQGCWTIPGLTANANTNVVNFPGSITAGGSTTGLVLPAGTAPSGAAGSAIYSVDATNGYAEVNENNTGLSRLCSAGNSQCAPASGIALTALASQAADTVDMNASGSSTHPTAVAMPTCTTGADLYNTTTHAWSCVSTSGASGTPLLNTNISRWILPSRSCTVDHLGDVFTTTGTCGDLTPTTTATAGADLNCSASGVACGYNGAFIYPAQVSGSVYQIQTTWPTNIGTNHGRYWVALNTTGLTNMGATDTPGTAGYSGVGIRYSTVAGDSSPQCVTFNGSTQNIVAPSPSITQTSLMKIEFDDAGASGWTIKVNGTAVCSSITTDIPASGALMSMTEVATPATANVIHAYFYGFQEIGQ